MMNFEKRREQLLANMKDSGYDLIILTDPSYTTYYTGYRGALGADWGRPGLFIVSQSEEPVLIVPSMEEEMAHMQTNLTKIHIWADGLDDEWRKHLRPIVQANKGKKIGIDKYLMPRSVYEIIATEVGEDNLTNVAPLIDTQRMIKDADELQICRHAGEVAVSMMKAAMAAAAPGVAEWEVSLAAREGGTRKAAELLDKFYKEYEPFNYPSISFQQIMASGKQTRMCHHRNSTTKLEYGEPLFTCYCGTTEFMGYHLGFDRTLFVGKVNEEVSKLLETAEKAQKAAFEQLYPGNLCENVFKAYSDVIVGAGYPIPFRTGRSQGLAANENPQLSQGDKTVLQAGMCLAVDGGANGPNYRTQVGDSVIITDTGYEIITPFTNIHSELVVGA